jgi:hypothetical protein
MKRTIFHFVFLFFPFLFITSTLSAQETENHKKSLYIGIEPFSFAIGYKGGFVDYRLNDKYVFNFYAGYYGWWFHYYETRGMEKTRFSDYYLASKGPVFRLGVGFVLSENKFRFSQVLFRPELTYKYLSYDNVTFYYGSNGLSGTYRETRSFSSNYFAINAIFGFNHYSDSFEEVSYEWFIGPGLGIAYEDMTILCKGSSCSAGKVNCNEHSSGIHFYPSIRFGVQIGFKIFSSKKTDVFK